MWRKFLRSFARSPAVRSGTRRHAASWSSNVLRTATSCGAATFTSLRSRPPGRLWANRNLDGHRHSRPPNTGTPTGGTVTFFDGSASLGTASSIPARPRYRSPRCRWARRDYGQLRRHSNFAASSTGVGPNSIITTVAGNGNTTYTATGSPPPPPDWTTRRCRGGRRRGPLYRRHLQQPDPRGESRHRRDHHRCRQWHAGYGGDGFAVRAGG